MADVSATIVQKAISLHVIAKYLHLKSMPLKADRRPIPFFYRNWLFTALHRKRNKLTRVFRCGGVNCRTRISSDCFDSRNNVVPRKRFLHRAQLRQIPDRVPAHPRRV